MIIEKNEDYSHLIQCDFLGANLASPIMIGSGPLTDSLGRIKKYFRLGAGAVVSKTIFHGNEEEVEEKVHTTDVGLFNSTTYSKRKIEAWIPILNELNAAKLDVIPSLHAETPEKLGELASYLNQTKSKMVELGIACPNDGSQQKMSTQLIYDYTHAVKKATDIPIIVKIAAVDGYLDHLYAALDAGAVAISLSDTLPSIAFDVEQRKYLFNGPAGFSGAAIKPIVLHAIYQARRAGVTCPIIGIGGIQSAEDVLEYLHVGANVVQIYTALMKNPHTIISDINQKLIDWCIINREEIKHINGKIYG